MGRGGFAASSGESVGGCMWRGPLLSPGVVQSGEGMQTVNRGGTAFSSCGRRGFVKHAGGVAEAAHI